MKPVYVVVTPAHNEEEFIEATLKSMVNQTTLPEKWVVVDDGSKDGTGDIVKEYKKAYSWIELVQLKEHGDRQFASKVHAFNAGYDKVRGIGYDIIGSLDADVSFESDYMEFLLGKFSDDAALGVAGTPFVEGESKGYDYRYTNIEHVSGACQLFRRECFRDIGGYRPIKEGGIDWVAVTTARMLGWKTRTFTEKNLFHHRKMGTGNKSSLWVNLRQGKKDYLLGNHPLWEVFRTFYQMIRVRPLVIGGLFLSWGYIFAWMTTSNRPIPRNLVKFSQNEQMIRLRKLLPGVLGITR
jgi:biofilm PGA synthesis N-glycosyltransferase PgaC